MKVETEQNVDSSTRKSGEASRGEVKGKRKQSREKKDETQGPKDESSDRRSSAKRAAPCAQRSAPSDPSRSTDNLAKDNETDSGTQTEHVTRDGAQCQFRIA